MKWISSLWDRWRHGPALRATAGELARVTRELNEARQLVNQAQQQSDAVVEFMRTQAKVRCSGCGNWSTRWHAGMVGGVVRVLCETCVRVQARLHEEREKREQKAG